MSELTASKERTPSPLEPVEISFYQRDGSESESRQFTPGAIYNYPNIALLKEAVRRQQGRLRRGTASTKTRSEIKGSNRKPWRQKGTGRARSGTRKSPLWRGGGVVFGPKPRKYDYGLPRKQRRLAIRHALLSKLLDGEARIVEDLAIGDARARTMHAFLAKIGVDGTCLLVVPTDADPGAVRELVLASRNLSRVEVSSVGDLNTLSLLRQRYLVLTASAFEEVQNRENESTLSRASGRNARSRGQAAPGVDAERGGGEPQAEGAPGGSE